MIQRVGKAWGMFSFGFQVVIIRIKRLKQQSLITILSISLVSSIFIGITFGSDTIQRNLVSETLNSVIIDMNIRIKGDDNFDCVNLKDLTKNISNINNVDRVIIKLFPNIDRFRESFILSPFSKFSVLGNKFNDQKTTLFGFSNKDLAFYQQRIQTMLKIPMTTLSFGESIISNYTANRLSLQEGDFFYVHYLMDSELESSYKFKVGSIWDITHTHQVFKDISQIPTDKIHETPVFTDFVLMEESTYLNMMKTFFSNVSNSTILNHGIMSVFVDHALMLDHNNYTMIVDQFSQLKKSILRSIERSLPPNMEMIWQSSLEKEIEIVAVQISHTVFSFTLFGLLIISLVLILYFIMIHSKTRHLKHFYGVVRLRGVKVSNIYYFFLFEGTLLGVFAVNHNKIQY